VKRSQATSKWPIQGRESFFAGGVPFLAGHPISSRRRPITSPPAPRVGSQNPASQFPKTGSFADFLEEAVESEGGCDPSPAHRAAAGPMTASDQIAKMASEVRTGLATAETPFAFILCICTFCHVRCCPFGRSIEIRASRSYFSGNDWGWPGQSPDP
jgi:hypothetical protein